MPDPVDPPAPKPDDTPPNPPPAPPPAADKTFTQTELDRIVQDRVARARPADYDDLKAKATKFDEIDAANKSELEKAQEAARKASEERDTARSEVQEMSKRTAVFAAAVKAGAVDPDAVHALLDKNAVTIGNDGQVTGADEAVKALLESKPYLVGKPASAGTGSADGGSRGNGDGPKQFTKDELSSMTPQQIVAARKAGQLKTALGQT